MELCARPLEASPCAGDWASPRASFSQDLMMNMAMAISPDRDPAEKEEEEEEGEEEEVVVEEEEQEEEFSFAIAISGHGKSFDLLHPHQQTLDSIMCSPDELFFNGKLLPLERKKKASAGSSHGRRRSSSMAQYPFCSRRDAGDEGDGYGESRSFEDRPRSLSMTIDNSRRPSRAIDDSSCYLPSPTGKLSAMAMHRESMAPSPAPPSSSASSTSASSASSSASSTSASSASMPASSSSSSASASAKYSSKLKEFFKLKKGARDHRSSASSSTAAIARDCPHSSVSSSCRISTSKSFWPFSRSNSAGESKANPPPPLPQRSNSAGEGKTTSSSLLQQNPNNNATATQQEQLATTSSNGGAAAAAAAAPPSAAGSSSPPKRSFSKHYPNRSDEASSSSSSSAMHTKVPKHRLSCSVSWDDGPLDFVPQGRAVCPCGNPNPSATTTVNDVLLREENLNAAIDALPAVSMKPTARRKGLPPLHNHHHTAAKKPQCSRTMQGSMPNDGIRVRSTRYVNTGNTTPTRSFARSSPGRRGGVWHSPGRGGVSNGTRIVIKSLERSNRNLSSRPKSMLSRDGSSVRVPPVINVPYMPARRGAKPPLPRPNAFTLGSLFSKKERDGGGAYALLTTPSDRRNGG